MSSYYCYITLGGITITLELDFIPKTEVLIEIGEGYVLSFPEPSSGVANTKAKGLKQLSKIRMFARLNDEVRSGYIDTRGFENYMSWKKFSDADAVLLLVEHAHNHLLLALHPFQIL